MRSIKNAFASLAVRDFSKSVHWYEQLFGRPADSSPIPHPAEWKFTDGRGVQVYAGTERAGGCSFTLTVSNLDEERGVLKRMGIAMDDRASTGTIETIMIRDPDGNGIAFAKAA
jgi:hypothetical protein